MAMSCFPWFCINACQHIVGGTSSSVLQPLSLPSLMPLLVAWWEGNVLSFVGFDLGNQKLGTCHRGGHMSSFVCTSSYFRTWWLMMSIWCCTHSWSLAVLYSPYVLARCWANKALHASYWIRDTLAHHNSWPHPSLLLWPSLSCHQKIQSWGARGAHKGYRELKRTTCCAWACIWLSHYTLAIGAHV